MNKILIVDDNLSLLDTMGEFLSVNGFSVIKAANGKEGLSLFQKEKPSDVILDLRLPDMNGIEVMMKMKELNIKSRIIILTGHGDIPTAVKAMKHGAFDFITKPMNYGELMAILRKAASMNSLEIENADDSSSAGILGSGKAVRDILNQIRLVASTNYSVILEGETGTGKTFFARTIHQMSQRASKPFVKIDVGTLPDTLVESELFGFERGAFSGADRKKQGLFEMAHNGTIFLDEIENMSLHVQAKLLNIIEERQAYHIGSTKPFSVDIRIIAATNKDIETCFREKRLRRDLFYRLNEYKITIPPLRERVEDISVFAEHFLKSACAEQESGTKRFSHESMQLLMEYEWPGNIRELKNTVKGAALLSKERVIGPENINTLLHSENKKPHSKRRAPLKDQIETVEADVIREALEFTGGKRTKAAELLKIDYKTLMGKIKKYGL